MQQIEVKRTSTNTHMITWTDVSVKAGDRCTFKDLDGMWDVIETYGYQERDNINRTWRVGGIDNPLE